MQVIFMAFGKVLIEEMLGLKDPVVFKQEQVQIKKNLEIMEM